MVMFSIVMAMTGNIIYSVLFYLAHGHNANYRNLAIT